MHNLQMEAAIFIYIYIYNVAITDAGRASRSVNRVAVCARLGLPGFAADSEPRECEESTPATDAASQ